MAELITEDVPRFWEAFEYLDDSDAVKHIQWLYLNPGSVGIHAFIPERIVSADHLVDVVRSYRAFYTSIRETSLTTIQNIRPRLENLLQQLPEVIPGAPDNDVHFVIGAMNSGGTLGREGGRAFAVIGLEFFSQSPTTVTHELDAWQRSVLTTPEALPAIVVHELIHTLQPHITSERTPTLLLNCLAEGAAEYLGQLVSGEVINKQIYEYGSAHEDELRSRFQRDVAADAEPETWLYQGNKAQEQPADLGYFIGARIIQAYHERYRGNPGVIQELLSRALLEPEEFTRESGYLG